MIEDGFNLVDTDGSGKVDKKEYEAALSKYGMAQKAKKMMAQVTNKNRQGAPDWDDVLQELDEDMNGEISWPELKAFIERMEDEHDFELSDEDWKQIKGFFDMVDADGSGEVKKEEFEAVFADGEKGKGLGQLRRRVMAKMTTKTKKAGKKL